MGNRHSQGERAQFHSQRCVVSAELYCIAAKKKTFFFHLVFWQADSVF